MLILSRNEVLELLDRDALVDALAGAMGELSAGGVSAPPRIAAVVPERDAILGAMPAYVPGVGVLETKLVSLFPRNAGSAVPTHQAVIVVFDAETGTPTALMDGTTITELRTAGGSALATRLLAREDAAVLAVFGTGVQAAAHARAVVRVRPIEVVRVAGRDPAKAAALAAELSGELDVPVIASASFAEAADGADVICACTHADRPVVTTAMLAPGLHVNSVGFNQQGAEVEPAAYAACLVVVESREAALAPPPSGSPDLRRAIADGLFEADQVHAEIGELVSGTRPGRTAPDQVTLYRSVGVGAQDAAAAGLVLAAARDAGIGQEIEI